MPKKDELNGNGLSEKQEMLLNIMLEYPTISAALASMNVSRNTYNSWKRRNQAFDMQVKQRLSGLVEYAKGQLSSGVVVSIETLKQLAVLREDMDTPEKRVCVEACNSVLRAYFKIEELSQNSKESNISITYQSFKAVIGDDMAKKAVANEKQLRLEEKQQEAKEDE